MPRCVIVVSLLVSALDASVCLPSDPTFRPKDYIIIVHEQLDGPALQQLLSHRFGSESWRYVKHSIPDGVTADSIKRIIALYYDSTEYAPLNILLVGTAKRKAAVGNNIADAASNNFVPTYFRSDAFDGWTAYDRWYVYLESGDVTRRIPRAVVGRIPARSEAEVQAYVSKVIAYETTGGDATWKRSALFLSGDVDRGLDAPNPEAVESSIAELADSLPSTMATSVIRHSDYADDAAREQAFIGALDPPEGKGLVVAIATGSNVDNLAYIVKRPDFNANSELQSTTHFPIVLAQSCNLGQIDVDVAPSEASLAENLLVAQDRGAVAVIGPTGWTSDVSNTRFLVECLNGLFKRGTRQVGNLGISAAMFSRSRQLGATNTYDMISVLGDPGMKIDLGSATVGQPNLMGTMELIERTPVQCTPLEIEVGVQNVRAGVIKEGHLLGERSYQIEGEDISASDATNAWVVFDELGLTIGPESRFLVYRVKPLAHPEGIGRFGIDCWLANGYTLSGCATCGPSNDQYGTDMLAANRVGAIGEEEFYAFDLVQAYGYSVDKLLITYDATNPFAVGPFQAVYDDIKFTSAWGYSPEVGPIEMQTNVIKGTTVDVSISASDPDIPGLGDAINVAWSVTHGYVSGQGLDVVYHAPSTTYSGAQITATVKDKGGHTVVVSKVFNIVNPPPPPTCPHVFVWNGSEYVDQGSVLSRSKIDDDSALVRDFHPMMTRPVVDDGVLKYSLREDGADSSRLELINLFTVNLDSTMSARPGVLVDGTVKRMVSPIVPSQCRDDNDFDQLAKISASDGAMFSAFGPGYLILRYDHLLTGAIGKAGDLTAEGGGLGLPGPPKDQYKLAVPQDLAGDEPKVPNYVSVSVFSVAGTWQEIRKVAPRSFATLPELIELTDYLDEDGGLWVKIEWTWSFTADDLCFYHFSGSGISIQNLPLLRAHHNLMGAVRAELLRDDGQRTSLVPGQRIDLEFDARTIAEFDFAVMVFRGKYAPSSGRLQGTGAIGQPQNVVVVGQNTPNPFNSGTTISFSLPSESHVRVTIHNVLGQEVAELENSTLPPGDHQFVWDGKDRNNRGVASGIYLYRVTTDHGSVSRKMVLLK